MIKSIHVLLCAGIIIGCCIGAENFIIPAKKNVSTGALKEECCQIFVDTLKTLSEILSTMGKIQEATLDSSIDIIQGGNSPLAHSKRSQLNAFIHKQKQFKNQLSAFHDILKDQLKFMERVSKEGVPTIDTKIVHVAGGVPSA